MNVCPFFKELYTYSLKKAGCSSSGISITNTSHARSASSGVITSKPSASAAGLDRLPARSAITGRIPESRRFKA